MASMHIDGDKPVGRTGSAEVPPYSTTSDDVFDERISHVAAKYRGTNEDQHGKNQDYVSDSWIAC